MTKITISTIKQKIEQLLISANFILPEDILEKVKSSLKIETNKNAKLILKMIIENAQIAKKEMLPLCQDCGNVYVNIGVGKNVCIMNDSINDSVNDSVNDSINQSINDRINDNTNDSDIDSLNIASNTYDSINNINNVNVINNNFSLIKNNLSNTANISFSDLNNAINEAVLKVYKNYYLRKSIVSDCLYQRKNTNSNTPAMIFIEYLNINGIKIEVNLKGGGSENCSWLYMLNPSVTEDEVIKIVLKLIKEYASKACPPLIVGIGIGGSAVKAVLLAKKAVFRNLTLRNSDKNYFNLENKLLQAINNTGVGPQGLGGKTTALACNIEHAPCHMATLPFAVFFGCHSTRRAETVI